MDEQPMRHVVFEFEADDRLWKSGQQALQSAVTDLQGEGADITLSQIPKRLPDGQTPRGPLEEIVIGAAADALGTLVVQLVLFLLRQPRHPRSIHLGSESSELEIDCTESVASISDKIHVWTTASVSAIQRLVIRLH